MLHIYRGSKEFVQGHRRNQKQSQDLHTDFSRTKLPNTLMKAFTSSFSVSASVRTAMKEKPSKIFLLCHLKSEMLKNKEFALTIHSSLYEL